MFLSESCFQLFRRKRRTQQPAPRSNTRPRLYYNQSNITSVEAVKLFVMLCVVSYPLDTPPPPPQFHVLHSLPLKRAGVAERPLWRDVGSLCLCFIDNP